MLDGISAVFPPKARIAILGPRNSGKTTLLRVLCGLELPTQGSVLRQASVSFPVGSNVRTTPASTIKQFLRFAAIVHGVDSSELTDFILRTSQINANPTSTLRELSAVDRSKLNFALGYALPFDCYLFDERTSPSSNCAVFTELFELRSANSATIFATRSPQKLKQYCVSGSFIYLLYEGKLTYVPSLDEAISIFGMLPDIEGPPERTHRSQSSAKPRFLGRAEFTDPNIEDV